MYLVKSKTPEYSRRDVRAGKWELLVELYIYIFFFLFVKFKSLTQKLLSRKTVFIKMMCLNTVDTNTILFPELLLNCRSISCNRMEYLIDYINQFISSFVFSFMQQDGLRQITRVLRSIDHVDT